MDIDQRKKIITTTLEKMSETLTSYVNKNGLHPKIVNDLIEGRLKGTRGVSRENRMKMENTFGKIFEG